MLVLLIALGRAEPVAISDTAGATDTSSEVDDDMLPAAGCSGGTALSGGDRFTEQDGGRSGARL